MPTQDNRPARSGGGAERLMFRDLADAVIKVWEHSGYCWDDMVDGFGGGSGGGGMPPVGAFISLIERTVERRLADQPEDELRRLMRSRPYQQHCDFERHWAFTHGNENFTEREELLGAAVWEYLLARMEREYDERPSGDNDEDDDDNGYGDGDDEDGGGKTGEEEGGGQGGPQLTLPGEWPEPAALVTRGGQGVGQPPGPRPVATVTLLPDGPARYQAHSGQREGLRAMGTTTPGAQEGQALTRFERALIFAARKHREQRRKGTDIPYISHLMQVAGLAQENGADEDEAIAALLHDVMEDQDVTGAEIAGRFGPRVAAIVAGCSDAASTDKAPWRERKEAYIAHIADASAAVRLVSSCDKLHNARAILADHRELGEALWGRFNAGRDETLWYYWSLVAAFREAEGRHGEPPSRVVGELARVVGELSDIVEATSSASPPAPKR